MCMLGGVMEGSYLIGCVSASSQVISAKNKVKAIAWWWWIVWRCQWKSAAPQSLLKWRCLIDVYFGRREGRLALDWMYLHKFSSNFCKNWSGGSSSMVRDCLVLLVDGRGAAITSGMAMFDWCVFREVWWKSRAWLDVSEQVLEWYLQ